MTDTHDEILALLGTMHLKVQGRLVGRVARLVANGPEAKARPAPNRFKARLVVEFEKRWRDGLTTTSTYQLPVIVEGRRARQLLSQELPPGTSLTISGRLTKLDEGGVMLMAEHVELEVQQATLSGLFVAGLCWLVVASGLWLVGQLVPKAVPPSTLVLMVTALLYRAIGPFLTARLVLIYRLLTAALIVLVGWTTLWFWSNYREYAGRLLAVLAFTVVAIGLVELFGQIKAQGWRGLLHNLNRRFNSPSRLR